MKRRALFGRFAAVAVAAAVAPTVKAEAAPEDLYLDVPMLLPTAENKGHSLVHIQGNEGWEYGFSVAGDVLIKGRLIVQTEDGQEMLSTPHTTALGGTVSHRWEAGPLVKESSR